MSDGYGNYDANDIAALHGLDKVREAFGDRSAPAKLSPLPTITVRQGELHNLATEAEHALIQANAPIYVRGSLVKPAVDDMAASRGHRTKVARLVAVTVPMLVDHLSRSATWQKYNQRKQGYVLTDPPSQVASTVLSRDGEWRLRPIVGAITSPTMRPDGSILFEAGYDQATRLVLLDPPPMPEIPRKPTKAQAASALVLLDGLLDGFPFVDAASRSVALSALITPVVRGALAVVPMHATTAPVPGSGKSYLVDLASAIAVGDRAPVISAGKTDEETEKRLASALLDGMPIISIDNVNGTIGGDTLCQYVERPAVAIRPLGVSKMIRIESRACVFATGNNIQILGDMTRRTLVCQLDPAMERPELRTFKSNPFAEIIANRSTYIAAALTIVRAYHSAGCPDQRPALASFEDWSRLVRSALVWLGRADPVETMETARAEDPELTNLSAVLTAWHDAIGFSQRTAGSVIDAANDRAPHGDRINPELFDALSEVAANQRGEIDAKRLGKYLARHKGRIVGGLRLVAATDLHAKQAMWRVIKTA